MNVVDILIILLLIIYVIKGFSNGAIKELVTFIGGFAVIVLAFILKNPLSVFLYENLPFFKFTGMLSGISVLNIIVYELISFLIVAAVLLAIYRIILTVSNLLETILKITIILEIPSKILGLVVGFIEGVFVTFVLLFICSQFEFSRSYIVESKYGNIILKNTPILSKQAEPIQNSVREIYDLAEEYKDSSDRNYVNLQALDVLLKYKVIDVNNAESLVNSGKLNIENVEEVLAKYKENE